MNRSLLSAAEAATALGIKRETLYAYVSRGALASHTLAGQRGSFFDPADVDRLLRSGRGQVERGRRDVIIESALTLIDPAGHSYRGQSAADLATTATLEEVAELLWTGERVRDPQWDFSQDRSTLDRVLAAIDEPISPLDVIRIGLPVMAAHDPMRADLRPFAVADLARRLLPTLFAAVADQGTSRRVGPHRAPSDQRSSWSATHAALQCVRPPSAAHDWPAGHPGNEGYLLAINRILVLMADHELAASTAAVRLAASFGADPYAALQAGHAAISGALHGAASTAVERFLIEVMERQNAPAVVGELLQRGQLLPGFGQPLYPDGDPRAVVLLELASVWFGDTEAFAAAQAIIELTSKRGLPAPNVDFAMATIGLAAQWRRGSGEILFALARMVGWIGHAIEEYEHRSEIRLRALYTGPRPV
jgi:citrate synthase